MASTWRNLDESALDLRLGGCIQGPPGSGKSFLVARHIGNLWLHKQLECLVVSPTITAKHAMSQKIRRRPSCAWQHLVLQEFRTRLRRQELHPFDILVVDEFTWLSKADLLAIADLPHPKVFVGDLQQLKAYPPVGTWPLFARLCNHRMHWVTPRGVTRYDNLTTACLVYLQEHQRLPPWAREKTYHPSAPELHAIQAGDVQGGAIRHPFNLVGLDHPDVTLEHVYVAISRATKWDNVHFEYTDRMFARQK